MLSCFWHFSRLYIAQFIENKITKYWVNWNININVKIKQLNHSNGRSNKNVYDSDFKKQLKYEANNYDNWRMEGEWDKMKIFAKIGYITCQKSQNETLKSLHVHQFCFTGLSCFISAAFRVYYIFLSIPMFH